MKEFHRRLISRANRVIELCEDDRACTMIDDLINEIEGLSCDVADLELEIEGLRTEMNKMEYR